MSLRATSPNLASAWGRAAALAAAITCVIAAPAFAQPKKKPAPPPLEQKADPAAKPAENAPAKKSTGKVKEQTFNFDGLGLNGRSRSPQLLYFLERANEELERASLEKRSFIPSMVKTVEEESL
jgi:hypothetical protein